MFQLLLTGHPRQLTLGARDHALINASMVSEIKTALETGGWTCHVCGVRLEGLMEVDHLKGHRKTSATEIKPICQFCHDLKHPIWALSRRRVFPIYAPDIDQVLLNRFSWSLLAELTRPKASESFEELLEALEERESAAYELLDGDNPEAASEALIVIRDRNGADEAMRVARQLDAQIRFVPACARDALPLQKWTSEGFRDVPFDRLHQALAAPPDFERLSRAAQELGSD